MFLADHGTFILEIIIFKPLNSKSTQLSTTLSVTHESNNSLVVFCRNRGRKRYRFFHSYRWIRIDGARLGVLLPVDGEDAAAKVSLWLIMVERWTEWRRGGVEWSCDERNVHGWTVECKAAKMPINTSWLFITVSINRLPRQTVYTDLNYWWRHRYKHWYYAQFITLWQAIDSMLARGIRHSTLKSECKKFLVLYP